MRGKIYQRVKSLLLVSFLIALSGIISYLAYFKDQRESLAVGTVDTPITKKVWVVKYDPKIPSQGNQRLSALVPQYVAYTDPTTLMNQFISDIKTASHNYLTYQIVGTTTLNKVPRLLSTNEINPGNIQYTPDELFRCLYGDHNCKGLDEGGRRVDYQVLINDSDLCTKSNNGTLDEVWFWPPEKTGFWEAVMTGPGAFDTNAPPIAGTSCNRQMHMMGFNYTREVGEMLESFGHRVEGTLSHLSNAFGEDPRYSPYSSDTDWGKFARGWGIGTAPQSNVACGNIHFPPNAKGAEDFNNAAGRYNYTSTTSVSSYCNEFLKYPDIPSSPTYQNIRCGVSGGWECSKRGFINWWLYRLPVYKGTSASGINGAVKLNNWWRYVAEFDVCPKPALNYTLTCESLVFFYNFSWTPALRNATYQLQLDTTNPLNSPYFLDTTVSGTQYSFSTSPVGALYGRVRVSNNSAQRYCVAPNQWSNVETIPPLPLSQCVTPPPPQ